MSRSSILIVEDEAIVAADLAGKVRQLGYDVAGPVATGEEAVELAVRQRPVLVLMDIRLAGAMDGIAAAEEIRRACQVPVVFLTAHSDQATVERARQADAFGYVLKPFDERELQIQIEMALYKYAAERRLRDLAADLERRVEERTAQLQASEARYRALVEQIPAVTYTAALDEASSTLFVGPQIETMLGFTVAEYVAHPDLWRNQLHPEDRDRVMREVQVSHLRQMPLSTEYRMVRRDGHVIWIEDVAVVVMDDAGQPALLQGVMFDVSARKQTEAALARSHRALRVLTEGSRALARAANEAELLNEMCRIVVEVGGYRMAWIGYAEQEEHKAVRPVAWAGATPDLPAGAAMSWSDSLAGREPTGTAIRAGRPCVCRDIATDPLCEQLRAEAGRRGYASALVLPLPAGHSCLGALTLYAAQADAFDDAEVELLQQSANDLAFGIQSLRARAERLELERQVLDVSERERRRLGQDLHDSVVQTLTGIRFLLSAVHQSLAARFVPEAGEVERITRLVAKSVQQADALTHGLFPGELARAGIAVALQDLATHTQDVFGLDCFFAARTSAVLADANVVSQVYRIAQEAVNNAVKHSQGKSISIQLSQQHGRLALTVSDTGVGFSRGSDRRGGLGQRIMKYRADMIGAQLTIDSTPGQGTTVTCLLPHAAPAWEASSADIRKFNVPGAAPDRHGIIGS